MTIINSPTATVSPAISAMLSPSAEAGFATTPMSSDELLLLFSQASDANAITENGIKDRLTSSINAKTLIGGIQSELQQLNFGGGDTADATQLKADLQAAISKCTDPAAQKDLQQAYQTYFGGNTAGNADNFLSTAEVQSFEKSLDNTTSSLDDNVQMMTLNLKQSQEKFSQVTDLVKDIMDSNNKIFEKIMAPQQG